ncbi:pyruvate:ferredoxin oxidoreductase Por [Gottschalkia acidurici 9a]|uniref:Pyruvate:ferredoxin oxidoreductase Por n=1 Tax=Gottschalkia acidurici (strain ATCC 7906 / DSM 604 / BCRC 14475 / CIP 104303 / KCTC 5404 / NCIMB 10678 / 9a) TaxID=1128398 RepID=K0B1Z5_GOTA9|nr:pyruvate:ferredoxin (flavodoxin) oxidoreductase [Gottschalkia acidurici]AFS79137.1 pyruvate:ferredoxin oxidoreductase Por [Gottschalkia acidurici 9a]
MTVRTKMMDGNEAAAYVSYAFTEVAGIYPITPSTPMAELVDQWSAGGKKNIFDQNVRVAELQSEAGAAGVVHGSLQGGALTTTYTASQGLLLMIPNMYKMAGELLPAVFHVSARAIAAHALSILGDHQDVMATRQTGFAMLASNSPQESMDLAAISHLSAIRSRVPFLHFFDGFRTSHEIQRVETIDYDDLKSIVDYNAIKEFRNRSLNPERPVARGTAQNQDIYFQGRESANPFYDKVPDIVQDYMNDIKKITGREYNLFDYYGHDEAERIIIAMGSVCTTIEETIDYLLDKGEKVGLIKVRLYRPFSERHFFRIYPRAVKKIAVLDRTKEPGSIGEPLYEDVRSVFYDSGYNPIVVGGRYGLGQKDTTPSQIIAVFENLKREVPKNRFTIGIEDDVTNTSLPVDRFIDTSPQENISCRLWGLGSDGTVGASKVTIKIIGDKTDLHAQGYFSYDSKKSGGSTVSHLRFGKDPIKSSYLVYSTDYISCNNKSFINHYDNILDGLKENGTFVLNCPWNIEELEEHLPNRVKRYLAKNNIKFYIINANEIANKIGLGNRINMIMQTVFFKLTNVIPFEDAIKYLKEYIKDLYGRKGDEVVNMNYSAVDKATEELIEVEIPKHWIDSKEQANSADMDLPEFIRKIQIPMAKQEGDKLPVSAFKGREDGTFPLQTTAYEKRGIATSVPRWIPENCIQCNQCSFICPHAVIRPFLLNDEEMKNAPETFIFKKAAGKGEFENLGYKIQISPLDCTGCSNCADVCPAPEKALVMVDAEEEVPKEIENWNYARRGISIKDELMSKETLKGSQFSQPLLEFSGACPGCGETAYLKLVTQLYGDSMMIANATGCSSIWSASAPSIAYCKNNEEKGPSWANSLFEDNAEYGYGMYLGVNQIRNKIKDLMEDAIKTDIDDECKTIFNKWIETMHSTQESKVVSKEVLKVISKEEYKDSKLIQEIISKKDFLAKKSQWLVGGDGWAYDIGFGGLDQVLASGEDINALVFDTEVYSNTGGQSSKSTPTSAVAKFAASGKRIRKKDLGLMAMTYGYVYVAQVAMGANMNQFMKAVTEAEKYKGPSLIICYAPCINHGIRNGMQRSISQEKRAVESGYWHLYRYNPALKDEGKNPFILDSKEPKLPFRDFILSELRFSQLTKISPDLAEELYAKAEEDSKNKYNIYKMLSEAKL